VHTPARELVRGVPIVSTRGTQIVTLPAPVVEGTTSVLPSLLSSELLLTADAFLPNEKGIVTVHTVTVTFRVGGGSTSHLGDSQ